MKKFNVKGTYISQIRATQNPSFAASTFQKRSFQIKM